MSLRRDLRRTDAKSERAARSMKGVAELDEFEAESGARALDGS
jgi:hypothetical protein